MSYSLQEKLLKYQNDNNFISDNNMDKNIYFDLSDKNKINNNNSMKLLTDLKHKYDNFQNNKLKNESSNIEIFISNNQNINSKSKNNNDVQHFSLTYVDECKSPYNNIIFYDSQSNALNEKKQTKPESNNNVLYKNVNYSNRNLKNQIFENDSKTILQISDELSSEEKVIQPINNFYIIDKQNKFNKLLSNKYLINKNSSYFDCNDIQRKENFSKNVNQLLEKLKKIQFNTKSKKTNKNSTNESRIKTENEKMKQINSSLLEVIINDIKIKKNIIKQFKEEYSKLINKPKKK